MRSHCSLLAFLGTKKDRASNREMTFTPCNTVQSVALAEMSWFLVWEFAREIGSWQALEHPCSVPKPRALGYPFSAKPWLGRNGTSQARTIRSRSCATAKSCSPKLKPKPTCPTWSRSFSLVWHALGRP